MKQSKVSWERGNKMKAAISEQRKFPTELKQYKYRIEEIARDHGLDFFPVIFEMLDYQAMSEIASFGGFPVRYPHWSFGMSYEETRKSHSYGLMRLM